MRQRPKRSVHATPSGVRARVRRSELKKILFWMRDLRAFWLRGQVGVSHLMPLLAPPRLR
jgi:hypothetical protein